jgi:hypothetical protein
LQIRLLILTKRFLNVSYNYLFGFKIPIKFN